MRIFKQTPDKKGFKTCNRTNGKKEISENKKKVITFSLAYQEKEQRNNDIGMPNIDTN